jgi:hypothetical protein
MKKRKTKQELDAVRNEIRRFFTIGSTPTEIKQHLKMADRTFAWHMSAIYAQDKMILQKESTELLATEILLTKDRLLRTIRICELISNANETSARDKLEAEALKKETSIDLIRLLRDAPTRIMLEHGHNGQSIKADVSGELPTTST